MRRNGAVTLANFERKFAESLIDFIEIFSRDLVDFSPMQQCRRPRPYRNSAPTRLRRRPVPAATRSHRLPGNRRKAKTDHLVEGRLRLLFMLHDQARITEPDASGVDEERRKSGVSRRKLA